MNRELEIRKYLSVIKRAVSLIETLLQDSDDGLLEQMLQKEEVPAIKPELTTQIPQTNLKRNDQHVAARLKHVQDLKAIDCWPEAVPSQIINVSEQDQISRANAVLDMMLDRSVENMTFLDFGCGEGWMAHEILSRGVAKSFGYDIVEHELWSKHKGAKYTTEINDLPKNYFDIIMLYDVLDHVNDPINVMKTVRNCLKQNGSVYVRCHPWTSRHATHLFKKGINKAYWHLFLTQSEIAADLKEPVIFTRMEIDPIQAYHWWFNEFEIKKEVMIKESVSEFFFVPAFKELLAGEQEIPLEEIGNFLSLMEVQFVDYFLKLK